MQLMKGWPTRQFCWLNSYLKFAQIWWSKFPRSILLSKHSFWKLQLGSRFPENSNLRPFQWALNLQFFGENNNQLDQKPLQLCNGIRLKGRASHLVVRKGWFGGVESRLPVWCKPLSRSIGIGQTGLALAGDEEEGTFCHLPHQRHPPTTCERPLLLFQRGRLWHILQTVDIETARKMSVEFLLSLNYVFKKEEEEARGEGGHQDVAPSC